MMRYKDKKWKGRTWEDISRGPHGEAVVLALAMTSCRREFLKESNL